MYLRREVGVGLVTLSSKRVKSLAYGPKSFPFMDWFIRGLSERVLFTIFYIIGIFGSLRSIKLEVVLLANLITFLCCHSMQ